MAVTLDAIGRCLVDMNELVDAKDHLERSLNIKQRISSDIATDRELAVTLHVLGRCLIDMNELVDAKDRLNELVDARLVGRVGEWLLLALYSHGDQFTQLSGRLI